MASLPLAPSPDPRRLDLERRARSLARAGLGWHFAEAGISIAAGIVASSVALIGFGADSVVEILAAVVLLWRFGTARAGAERLAQQLIAATFVLIAVYVGVEAIRSLSGGDRPGTSTVGILMAAVTVVGMPLLARAKQRVAAQLHSSATASEARQTAICGYLSAALLVGLVANAAAGWWWADPLAALVIAGACVLEARNAWRGEACCGGHCHA